MCLLNLPPKKEIHREPNIKLISPLNLPNILIRKINPKSLDIPKQMLNLAPTNNRNHIRRLAHHIRKCHTGDNSLMPRRNGLKDLRYSDIRCTGRGLPSWVPGFGEFFALSFGFEGAAADCAPWCEAHSF